MRLGITAACLAALTAAYPAGGQVKAPDQAFEAALAARDLSTAGDQLDRLIAARLPSEGKAKADPYLNHRVGRFLLAAGQPREALPWLEAATGSPTTPVTRAGLILDQARAMVQMGHASSALPLIETALGSSDDPAMRNQATRLKIDALLVSDPVAAAATLAATANLCAGDPQWEWDWALLDARAALLTDSTTAAAKVRHAWNSAITAPIAASAPARAAAMMAMVEERAGNRAGAIAMIAAAARIEPDVSALSRKLSAILPPCSTAIAATDQLTVALHRDSVNGTARISAISASRPGLVPLFLHGIDANRVMSGNVLTTSATVVRLRCRVSPASVVADRAVNRDPVGMFMAPRGLFPRFGSIGTVEEQVNASTREVDDLTARFGMDNPILLGPMLRLVMLSHQRAMDAGDIPPARLRELSARLDRILVASGDTSSFLPPDSNFFAAVGRALNTPSREDAAKLMSETFRTYIDAIDFAAAYALLSEADGESDPLPLDPVRAALLARAAQALPAGDDRIAALRVARVAAARKAADGTLDARIREAGLPRDLCTVQTVLPRLRSTTMSDDDYPVDALVGELTGRSLLEFDVSGSGQVVAPRTIIAVPPILFDDVVARQTSGIRYHAGQSAGKPVTCRAMVMAIRWKMPENSQEVPDIVPQRWVPGS